MRFGACEVSVSIEDSTVNDVIVASKNIQKLNTLILEISNTVV